MAEDLNVETMQQLFRLNLYMPIEAEGMDWFSLGENSSRSIKLIFLIRDLINKKGDRTDIDLLNKIADFKEYGLKREEVIVINLVHQSASFLQLKKKFGAVQIVAFGITPNELSLQVDVLPNILFSFRETKLIFTSSLKEIMKDEKLKNQFFREGLKPMFSSFK